MKLSQNKVLSTVLVLVIIVMGLTSSISLTASAATNQKYIEISSQLVEAGTYAIQQENYDDAVNLLERAIVANPENGVAYVELARAYVSKGQYQRGIKYYDIALAIDPADLTALEGRALTNLKQMDLVGARESFQSIQRICAVRSCEELLTVSSALEAFEQAN